MILTINPDPEYWGQDATVESARAEFDTANTVFRDAGFVLDEIKNESTTSEEWVFWNGGDREELDWFGLWCATDGNWNDVRVEIEESIAWEVTQ